MPIDSDHAQYAPEYLKNGIDIYTSQGTIDALRENLKPNVAIGSLVSITKYVPTRIGNFEIIPFPIIHDAPEPFGFMIYHPEAGTILFATDTYCLEDKFDNVNHWLIEANYDTNILHRNLESGKITKNQYDRVLDSHMEIDTTKKILSSNDLSAAKNIILIHLSAKNSDAITFQNDIESLTGIRTYIAKPDLEIQF